jgi:hypothetical protein
MNPRSTRIATGPGGLGTRRIVRGDSGFVDVLVVAPHLAQRPLFEMAVRARAARFADVSISAVTKVRRIDREGEHLSVTTDHIEGIRLLDLLEAALLPPAAALPLAADIIRTVAALHQKPGLTHGAITPAHVVITATGSSVLTDSVFGTALESLACTRDALWRDFRIAMPPSAGHPRFDVRADVTQLASTVLSVLLGRMLGEDEYPRGVAAAIDTAVSRGAVTTGCSPALLGLWLHQALQLHSRETFSSALEAERAFALTLGTPAKFRAAMASLQMELRDLMASTPAAPDFSAARTN